MERLTDKKWHHAKSHKRNWYEYVLKKEYSSMDRAYKLGQYEDLEEEELGIGFDLFVKILKAKRIWYKDAFVDVANGRSPTTRILAEERRPYAYYDDSCGAFMISVANKTFLPNRYGIDYALTKEELSPDRKGDGKGRQGEAAMEVAFNDGVRYEIEEAGRDGILVFKDIAFQTEFDREGLHHDCGNDWETSALKKYLEDWWDKNAPEELKDKYDVGILSAEDVFDQETLDGFFGKGKTKSNQLPLFKND